MVESIKEDPVFLWMPHVVGLHNRNRKWLSVCVEMAQDPRDRLDSDRDDPRPVQGLHRIKGHMQS